MKITNVFDAVMDGSLTDVKKFYDGNINEVCKLIGLNLLCAAMTNVNDEKEKIKIIKFLIKEGIDVNYRVRKYQRNAMHLLFFCNYSPSVDYAIEVCRLLINAGINVNQVDDFGAIPLKYAISINKLSTQENAPLYRFLLENGSDYRLKDRFEKSCLDYAKEYSWRNEFIEIVEEFENGN